MNTYISIKSKHNTIKHLINSVSFLHELQKSHTKLVRYLKNYHLESIVWWLITNLHLQLNCFGNIYILNLIKQTQSLYSTWYIVSGSGSNISIHCQATNKSGATLYKCGAFNTRNSFHLRANHASRFDSLKFDRNIYTILII